MRIAASIVLCGTLFAAGAAQACSCGTSTQETLFDWADHVFVAQIRSLEDVRPKDSTTPFGPDGPKMGVDYGLRVAFEPLFVVKGDPGALEYLSTGYGGGDCGFSFLPGLRYLVATKTGAVGICSLTRPFEMSSCADVEQLERLQARAKDGTTKLELTPRGEDPEHDRAFAQALQDGADPFRMSSRDCPRDRR